MNSKGLYDIIKENNYKFKESIGLYYQEEASGDDDTTSTPGLPTDDDTSSVPEANLTLKRVITYTIQF